jgi:6-pyruvoyltetrahydropterin/6-carboxytetrahydropterin synthase
MHGAQCEVSCYDSRPRGVDERVDLVPPGTYWRRIMPISTAAAGIWRVQKTYGHERGLSCAFRQWQAAHSHCRFLHGYALSFRFTFATGTLDGRGWCVDFGGLKPLAAWLHANFDHTVLVARDDPDLEVFRDLEARGLVQLRVVDAVGCEAFAAQAHGWAASFLARETGGRVVLERVEVSEHPGNAASFTPDTDPG